MSGCKIVELDTHNTCKLCDNALAKYSCPKCNILYCSVACYQSPQHLECSEEFYKSCISEEMRLENNEAGQKKMQEILQRFHSGEESQGAESCSSLDSDDEDFQEIIDRLEGVDLDNSEEVWEKLTEDERQDFVAFLKSQDIAKMLPQWEPWWLLYTHKNIEDADNAEDYRGHCPELVPIQKFLDLSKKPPAECVKFNLVNILAAYVFTLRYFNGEYKEFPRETITCLVNLSLALSKNHNFEDFDMAVKSVEFEATNSEWIQADIENFRLMREDLEHILKGPKKSDEKHYILAALSDLRGLLQTASTQKNSSKGDFSKTFPNHHFPVVEPQSKNRIKNYTRKIDYLLSYTKDIFSW